jgi:hypothetical protein
MPGFQLITALSFFRADLLFVRIFPFPQLRMKGPGKGNQDEEGDENTMLQPSQYSGQQAFTRNWAHHVWILPVLGF